MKIWKVSHHQSKCVQYLMREKEGIEKRIYGTDRDVFVSFADFSREW